MLNLIDEHTRESLLVRPERRWSSAKVIEALADVMVIKGVPEHIRSDKWSGVRGPRSSPVAGGHRGQDTVHRARQSVGERLLRIVQLQAARRVPQRRDLLLTQGGAGAGRTLAHPLQHHPASLFAGLPVARARDVASRDQNRVWGSGKQTTLPTSPHPSTAERYRQNSLR